MSRWCYFTMLSLFPFTGLAQSQFKHAIYLETGGNGVQYSINYEYKFRKSFVAKIGGGMSNSGLFIPLTFGKVFFSGAHHLETSLGFTFAHYSNEAASDHYGYSNRLHLASFFGYRYDKPDRRFFLKIGFTPFYLLSEMDMEEIEEGNRFISYFGFGGGIKIGKR